MNQPRLPDSPDPMTTDQDQREDFRSRLVKAAAELDSMADGRMTSGHRAAQDAAVRLYGKADGVRLALSYWDEADRG